jgi:predicted transcriptional regulator
MERESTTHAVDPRLVKRIVSSYVQHHKVSLDQLPGLIAEVHRTLAGLRRRPASQEVRTPAVPVRRSVQRDYVVCLDCGYRGVMLRRHIRVAHELTSSEYRDRWKLSVDHPLTAPSYSARRSVMAKQLGLGHVRPRAAVAPAPAPASAAPSSGAKRRGRPRKQPSATT